MRYQGSKRKGRLLTNGRKLDGIAIDIFLLFNLDFNFFGIKNNKPKQILTVFVHNSKISEYFVGN